MKKIELKFWLSCMMMALCIGFTACDDDDEGIDGDAKALIIGTWEGTWTKGYEIYNGKKETWDEEYGEGTFITFKSDGTATLKEDIGNNKLYTENYTWSISGNKLFLKDIDNDDDNDEYIITTLNSGTLILTSHDKDGEDEYYEETTFKKR